MSAYADLALLKFHLSSSSDGVANFTAEDDILLQRCLDAATLQIEQFTGRTFRAEAAATKTFIASCYDTLDVRPDVRAVTGVTVDDDGDLSFGLTLAATDYWLLPVQGFPDSGIYSRIQIAPRSSQAFSPGYQVRVTGDWGYVVNGEAPSAVIEACLLQASRLWARRGTPLSIMGGADLQTFARITKSDDDVKALLLPYRAASAQWVMV